MMKVSKIFNFLFLCVYSINYCHGQSLPPVNRFQIEDYGADNQNWSITQTQDNILFFANGKGLLKFDAEQWELYDSPNSTVLRSVYAVGNKVYSGAYMEFGVWTKNKLGSYAYTSLSKDIPLIEDEQFWTISSLEDYIIFQSLDAIYILDSDHELKNKIKGIGEITKMVILDNELYFHEKNAGLYKLSNGQKTLLNNSKILKASTLINVYEINGQLFAQTQFNGIINVDTNQNYRPSNSSSEWSELSVYSSIQKQNGDIYLGTISNGFYKISNDSIVYNLNQKNTLSNNTVLSVFNDKSNNIWLGLDNGINTVDDNSKVSIFNDVKGEIGTIYTSTYHDGLLYIGSNQGLFYYDDSKDKFSLVKGTNGQVWSLFDYNGTLFCGHHNGTYIIDKQKSLLLNNTRGTWTFRVKDENTILSGNYDGLYLYKLRNRSWTLEKKITGFDISAQYFEFIDSTSILVNHEYKGVYKLNLNEQLSHVSTFEIIKSAEKGLFSSIVKYKGSIYYAYKEGVFKYNNTTAGFEKDSILSKIITPKNFTTGIMVKTDDDKLWFFNDNNIVSISNSSIKDRYIIDKIPIHSKLRQQPSGYENISYNGKGAYIMGRSNGYLKINSSFQFDKKLKAYLSIVSIKSKDNLELKNYDLTEIDNDFNTITFHLSSFTYEPLFKSEYQYKLSGYNNDWSAWQEETKLNFTNLTHGDYTLFVRTRVGENNVSDIEALSFTIQKPFYLSTPLVALYVVLIVVISLIIHLLYRSYYRKQKRVIKEEAEKKLRLKELEAQKEIMDVNNNQLKLDIENKNRELAISTMSLIKKNEFLSNLKMDLKPLKSKNSLINKVVKSIDMNIDSQDDWKFFEEAFNNADKDFFKVLKQKHPSLTHNDFKLCAYLRLNLSSKEIAPLFNISTKSVEIKRYRLRKKMNLEREQSLTEYILSI